MQKAKSVMRWDAKKKKYQIVAINSEGKKMKQKGRNEAGAKVTGEVEKSDIYSKWMKNKKNRIQQVGELESGAAEKQFLAGTMKRSVGGLAGAAGAGGLAGSGAGTVTFGDDDVCESKANTSYVVEKPGQKPIVPFHGVVDSKFLTNKQKRMTARRERNAGEAITGKGKLGSGTGIKSADEIRKQKKKELDRRLKNDKDYRKTRGKELKDAYWERQNAKIAARAARPRSFKIMVGGKKDVSKKMEKRARGGKRGFTYV